MKSPPSWGLGAEATSDPCAPEPIFVLRYGQPARGRAHQPSVLNQAVHQRSVHWPGEPGPRLLLRSENGCSDPGDDRAAPLEAVTERPQHLGFEPKLLLDVFEEARAGGPQVGDHRRGLGAVAAA